MPAIRRQRGFTLIEMVAAFVIFAIGFGILLQILSTCLHTTAQSAEYTHAALCAQSVLDIQGVGEPLQEGDSSGRFDDTYSWQLHITRIDPPPVEQPTAGLPNDTNAQAPQQTQLAENLDLYQLVLDVSWGNALLQHHARFVTLRTQNPDPGQIRSRFLPFGGPSNKPPVRR